MWRNCWICDHLALADELSTRVTRSYHNRYVYLWQGGRHPSGESIGRVSNPLDVGPVG
uniref:Uncharacterized protein n=1 Tax=Mycobacterium riyadhense TaxID=486698 RepID=A0A653EIB9_9MYCO|nr:hypothetical protein BIN_B_01541 [Mycobacterium riyadhense]